MNREVSPAVLASFVCKEGRAMHRTTMCAGKVLEKKKNHCQNTLPADVGEEEGKRERTCLISAHEEQMI
jgi:hypothetical protein